MRACRNTRHLRPLTVLILAVTLPLGLAPLPAEAAPPSAAPPSTTATIESELTALLNTERAAHGVGPLVVDVRLVQSSRSWSVAQAAAGTMQHDANVQRTLPPGTERWGENVGRSNVEDGVAAALHAAFLGSANHRATMLDPGYTAVGIGVHQAGGTTWVTERLTAGSSVAVNPADAGVADAAGTDFGTGGAERAVIVRDDDFPDALAASALAGDEGPVLFAPPGPALLPDVRAALDAVLPKDRTVYVIGGVEAVDPAVDTELSAAGWRVIRVAGDDRFATAAEVARTVVERDGPADTVLLATGENWPDAAAGAAYASRGDAVVLLAERDDVPAATRAALDDLDPGRTVALGGTAVLSDDVVAAVGAGRVAGSSREETAVAIAAELWDRHDAAHALRWTVVPANDPYGWTWAFGVAPAAAALDAPTLLVADPVGGSVVRYLDSLGYGEIIGEALLRGPVAEASAATLEEHLR